MQANSSVDRSLTQINTLLSGGNFEAKDIDVQDFSRIISKMPARHVKDNINAVVAKLFEVAASKMKDDADKAVLQGLKKYVNLVQDDLLQPKPRYLDAFFFPNEANITKLINYLGKAQKSMSICIFSLTNDKLANAVYDAHARGVKVRVISDDECMNQIGSDVKWLAGQGVPCRVDSNSQFHMHNKFVIIDDTFLITGSFNWTVQAGKSNQENLLVVDNPYYIEKYSTEFENLWKQFASNQVEGEAEEEAATKIQQAYRNKKGYQGGNQGGRKYN
ncbi:UNKNOWN [Stylonychia lemnae]|uniref:Mitochondrial cardiolipin hydrolase n=1 Tax=Stylonychia lemnae TaxID=5949 RepID=A0A078AJS6_STYLE|nr:UNKNOWN [Stylonychia lemnae]|eukprot:CDW81063.1 UNKNOWN [Stylonychia lemnae]